jgi:hypothetical protein
MRFSSGLCGFVCKVVVVRRGEVAARDMTDRGRSAARLKRNRGPGGAQRGPLTP